MTREACGDDKGEDVYFHFLATERETFWDRSFLLDLYHCTILAQAIHSFNVNFLTDHTSPFCISTCCHTRSFCLASFAAPPSARCSIDPASPVRHIDPRHHSHISTLFLRTLRYKSFKTQSSGHVTDPHSHFHPNPPSRRAVCTQATVTG